MKVKPEVKYSYCSFCGVPLRNEVTSRRVGLIASKVMNGLITVDNIKVTELNALAASCLTQLPNKTKSKK